MNQLSFTEFEAFTESVRDADVRMRLPALDVSRWTLTQFQLGSIHVQLGLEGSGNIAEGSIRPDGWVFYNQISGTWGLANGERMRPNATVVIPPGSEFCFACPEGQHNWYSVFVPTSLLVAVPGEEQAIRSVSGSGSSIEIHQSRCMQDLVERLSTAVAVEPAVLATNASATAFQEEIRSTATRLLRVSPGRDQNPKVSRQDMVQSAVELIDRDRECSLTIAKIAELSEIPERTLRKAFNDWFGVSPRQYLSLRRLHDARKMLYVSCPDQVTVAHVAVAHGFWDLGRFAGRYRKVFGELPSATLRRKAYRDYERSEGVAMPSNELVSAKGMVKNKTADLATMKHQKRTAEIFIRQREEVRGVDDLPGFLRVPGWADSSNPRKFTALFDPT